MAMKEYSIKVPNGMTTTVLLSDDDAKRAGLMSEEGKMNPKSDPAKQPETIQAAKDELERQRVLQEEAGAKSAAAANQQANPENK